MYFILIPWPVIAVLPDCVHLFYVSSTILLMKEIKIYLVLFFFFLLRVPVILQSAEYI